MPIDNPTALVEEFKKSGEFDRLRRELLAQFQQDASYPGFKEGVEDIARKRMTNDQSLHYLGSDSLVLKELTQEIQRYPIVERAVANVRTFSDPAFLASMQRSMQKILHDEKGGKSSTSVTSKDVPESETTRMQVTQGSANQPEKAAQDAQQNGDPPEHAAAPVVDSHPPTESPPQTETLANSTSPKAPSGEDNTRGTGSSIPINPPPKPNQITSESSSVVTGAENANLSMVVKDQHQTPPDIEMADVQVGH